MFLRAQHDGVGYYLSTVPGANELTDLAKHATIDVAGALVVDDNPVTQQMIVDLNRNLAGYSWYMIDGAVNNAPPVTVSALRDQLAARGLNASGTRAELEARLAEASNG